MQRRRLLTRAALPALLAVATLLGMAIDRAPLVERSADISPGAVARAKDLFQAKDPHETAAGDEQTAILPIALLDHGIDRLARHFLDGRASLVVADGRGEIRFTMSTPVLPGFINLRAGFRTGREMRFIDAAVGSLPLPPALLEAALRYAIDAAGYGEDWQLFRTAVRQVDFTPDSRSIAISYVWKPEILGRVRSMSLPPLKYLEEAQTALAALLAPHSAKAAVPLPEVLRRLLPASGPEVLERRRAALLVLAAQLTGKDMADLVPQARAWRRPKPATLTLDGRHDAAQHFVVSATLAAWTDEPLADAVGLYKEFHDSRYGSGFSFADLAADRAGARFGQLVSARDRRLDALLARPLEAGQLLPRLDGLPEHLSESEFKLRFGSRDSGPYRKLIADIERRLAAMPLYR